jgi:hypothetical protein
MIDPNDPPRLRDMTDTASSGLGDVFRAAERDVGSDEQVARLAVKLGSLLAAPVAITTTAAGLGSATKVGLGMAALIAAGGGAWLLSTHQPVPPPVPTPAPVVAPAKVTSPEASLPAPPPATEPEVRPEASAPAGQPAISKPAPVTPGTEAELLEQARSALKSDPARALARANAHAARFPGGALVQEREVIAIKALRQLGRNAEAERRSEAFVKAFPGSAFARKLKPSP